MSPVYEQTVSRIVNSLYDSISTTSYTNFIISLILVCSVYHYYWNFYSYFKRRGVTSGPTPYPLVGSLHSILLRDRLKLERDWTEKYGKFYGVFFGTRPRFTVNDAEVLRQICIKDFDSMPNHDANESLSPYQEDFIFFSQDDHWKRLRLLQRPTFTSGKIKRMFKLLDRCADDLVLCFSEHLNNGKQQFSKRIVNIKDMYSLFTMDAITSVAYTIRLDRKQGQSGQSIRHNFVTAALKIFIINVPRIFIQYIFPSWFLKAIDYNTLPINYFKDLDDRLRPLVNRRIKSDTKTDDYLQLLVDARLDGQFEHDEMDEKENHHAALTADSLRTDQEKMIGDIEKSGVNMSSGQSLLKNKSENHDDDDGETSMQGEGSKFRLNEREIISSAIFLLVTGIETTALLLTNCTYALAFHQDIQQRLYEVIKSIAEFNNETGTYSFEYDQLTSCEYLDAVISESLRILSPVIHLDRVVSRDYYLEKYNVKLKKGDRLHLAYYAIMNNPEYWPEPLKFDPDRFMGENKQKIVPGSYCPFGLGPRHCMGMRFSLTEAKLALSKVLMNFKFTPAPGTKFLPDCKSSLTLTNLKDPRVELAPRV